MYSYYVFLYHGSPIVSLVLHHFELAKMVTSRIRVKLIFSYPNTASDGLCYSQFTALEKKWHLFMSVGN